MPQHSNTDFLYSHGTSAPVPAFKPNEAEDNEPIMREALRKVSTVPAEDHARAIADGATAARKAPKMHSGGVVKHDGLHNLQKGEVVIPKEYMAFRGPGDALKTQTEQNARSAAKSAGADKRTTPGDAVAENTGKEGENAARSKSRGVIAAGIEDRDVKKKFIAAQGEGKLSDQDLDNQAYRVRNAVAAGAVPTLHDGGLVKKDGLHNLQKGEGVISKDTMKNAKGLMAGLAEASEEKSEPKDKPKSETKSDKKHSGKHRHKMTHIEHHADGSHTVRHEPMPNDDGSPNPQVSYAAPDMNALHAGLDQNLGAEGAPPPAAPPPAQA